MYRRIRQNFAWLLEKVGRDGRPPSEHAKEDPEDEKASRLSVSDLEHGNVNILECHTIWPNTENQTDIDRIFKKLGAIIHPSRLAQVGGKEGQAAPLMYWYVILCPDEFVRIQELEGEEVSEINFLLRLGLS